METLFKSNRYCGNCFWFLPDDQKCHFFQNEPDMCEKSCNFFESKANARKIIQANVVRMDDEDGVWLRRVDPHPNGPWLVGNPEVRSTEGLLRWAERNSNNYTSGSDPIDVEK